MILLVIINCYHKYILKRRSDEEVLCDMDMDS